MHDSLRLAMVWAAGLALGLMFFGGLWWTVRQGLVSNRPALWMLISVVVRFGVLLTGFYYLSGGQWHRMLACVIGFITAKLIATWLATPTKQAHDAT